MDEKIKLYTEPRHKLVFEGTKKECERFIKQEAKEHNYGRLGVSKFNNQLFMYDAGEIVFTSETKLFTK